MLDAHHLVAASRVRPGADSRLGEQVHADIQVRPGADPASVLQDLSAWCSERLAPLKRPATYAVVEAMEMTASGKIRR